MWGGRWERPTPCTSALAAGQPYPSHSEHCLKSWSSQGPCGPALLARHAYLFMGTFSSPCGLSRVTWQAKEMGDKCYLWLASGTFLPGGGNQLRGPLCLFSLAALTTGVRRLKSLPLAGTEECRGHPGGCGKEEQVPNFAAGPANRRCTCTKSGHCETQSQSLSQHGSVP